MRVMGVDLSTKAGVALVDDSGEILTAGVVTHPKLTGMERVNAIVADILDLHSHYAPEHIYIEDYALGLNMGAVIIQLEISTVLQFILWQEGIQVALVHPGILKKFVTGSGAAKKELVMLEVYKRWGHSAAGNDEADAVALAFFGLASAGNAISCTKPMLEVVSKWKSDQIAPVKKSKKSKT